MVKKLIGVCLISLPGFIGQAQGISFEHHTTWQEVLEKAKAENKYVFVDCYASWCGPCKWMDKNVYSDDTVAKYMRDNFISVRIQMDTTQKDDQETQSWYRTARDIGVMYHIATYPSYLFFSPDGQAVHKNLGAMNSKAFLSMTSEALDPRKQYYTLLFNYRHGAKDFSLMPILAKEAWKMGQDSLSRQVGRDYIVNYLESLPEQKLWTTDNITFVSRFSGVLTRQDKIFQSYYRDRKKVDSIMGSPNFADNILNLLIYRDEIGPRMEEAVKSGEEPNWNRLEKAIAGEYNEYYAEVNVNRGRIGYYKRMKKWNSYIRYFIRQKEADGIENRESGAMRILDLNNSAYEVFQYSRNKAQLKEALSWVNLALSLAAERLYPGAMDTKANLLYKLGKKAEGLELEKRSYTLEPNNNDIKENYRKMTNGLPTWLN